MRVRMTCACLLVVGIAIGFWCGRLTTPEQPASKLSVYAPSVQGAPDTPGSAAQLNKLRAGLAEHQCSAGEALAWLERLPQAPQHNPTELTYDSLAVYHAIKLLGELRYAPAVPFLVREAIGHRLWIANPDVAIDPRSDVRIEKQFPIYASLVQIGPPSAPPLVDEYLRVWKWDSGQERDVYLDGIQWALGYDSLIGAALRSINDRLAKANFIEIDRDELDALQHLKRELLKGID